MVVPGLYGYVSATKWVIDMEVTRFEDFSAFWTERGWSAEGPIKTQSRIDVPRSGEVVRTGPVTFGGVAWAQNRGVKGRMKVPASTKGLGRGQLGAAYSNETWRLWGASRGRPTAQAQPTITVRATDDAGAVHDRAVGRPPVPDGATGWHSVNFSIA